jgi:hypothetical protein
MLVSVKRKGRAPSDRATRRKAERAREKLGDARERLWVIEGGGSPAHPLEVAAPSVVESHVADVACPLCDGVHELVEHAAVTLQGTRLREARLRCRQCGSRRSLWFRLIGTALN